MQVTVVGTGYVGLVAGACFAEVGHRVICVDHDLTKVERLKKGQIPIYEPGLEDLVHRSLEGKRISFTQSIADGVAQSEVVFFAVGTPSLPSGEADLSYLKAAAQEVGRNLKNYCLIVNKSTVPIGTHQKVIDWVKEGARCDFDFVSNPEFLKEGTAVEDFLRPDRVVIGTEKEAVYKKMVDLYSPFVRQGNPILWMDAVSAEMTKYACNAFLATRISFMNELSALCDRVGGDIEQIRRGMSLDERIGKYFLYAGVGYGGSCFPKDVQALISTAQSQGVPMGIVAAAEQANLRQKSYLASQVKIHFGENLQGKVLGVWGLAFKPNTDDMRDAPALTIISELVQAGATVRVYDPIAMENAKQLIDSRVQFCATAMEVAEGADALLLVTEWNEFKNPDFNLLKKSLRKPIIFDGRNVFSPSVLRSLGFTYLGIGRAGARP
jgi:UDPglucose 6-dehydrogenase